jgi:carboxylate-amine ligase
MAEARSVGVEEELLLVRASTGELASAATDLVRDPRAGGQLWHEFKREQIEINSDPSRSMQTLSDNLTERRQHLVSVAAEYGLVACASGTSPLAGTPTAVAGDRFARITDEFALMATQQLTCGMHVHISVGSPEEGVGVLDRIRGWLPCLTALCANSPYWHGADSGYASYRMIVLSQLPPVGPSPVWGSHAAYQRAVEQVVATGAAFDPGMVYFDARLSATYPTVEIRVTDVCRRIEEAVLVSALCRALVDTAAAAWEMGEPAPDLATVALRSASWRAARFGMSQSLFDPQAGGLAPAWQVIDALLRYLGAALRANGDDLLVREALRRIADEGTGADAQRRDRAAGRSLQSVLLGSQISARRSPVRCDESGLSAIAAGGAHGAAFD